MIAAQLRFSRNGRRVLKEILRKLLLQLSLIGMLTTIAGIAVKRKLRLILDRKMDAEQEEVSKVAPEGQTGFKKE